VVLISTSYNTWQVLIDRHMNGTCDLVRKKSTYVCHLSRLYSPLLRMWVCGLV